MAEIEIRLATLDDLPLISGMELDFETDYVWKSQMIEDVDSRSVTFQSIKLPKTILVPFQFPGESAVEGMIRRQGVVCASFEGQLAGFLRLEQDDNPGRIIMKIGGVRPDFRRKGVASALLRVVQDMAIANRISQLVFTLQAKNDPAIRFLTARGFQFCGYQEFYFPNLEIALFFSKNIR